ncbi:MAG: DUF2298 domain-containing protein, partial [Anaerolineales bacterium]
VEVWDALSERELKFAGIRIDGRSVQLGVLAVGSLALIFTALWAFAFSRIYASPHPRVAATRWIFQHIPGPATLEVDSSDGERYDLLSYPEGFVITYQAPWQTNFTAKNTGFVESVYFPAVLAEDLPSDTINLQVALNDPSGTPLGIGQGSLTFAGGKSQARISLNAPVELQAGETYQFLLALLDPGTAVSLGRIGIANESSWDDGLPLRMDGYDPFGGIYQGGLNFEMYWDDNQEKLDRFLSTMDQAQYILITSSRQWATTTRVPERYPLTTEYYRQLMGCPVRITIEDCYNTALPGTYQGSLGFELIETFQSNPHLGSWEINDQPAEEAFTVYDHPKVFIFKKSADYDPQQVADILSTVDLTKVIHITPKQADSHPGNLMLPEDRLAVQRQGGTWSDIFNPNALHNRSQLVAALVWYLSVFVIGLVSYPLIRLVLPGLDARGYPLSRTFGLLILSYLVWLAGSAGIPFQRITIATILLLLAALGLYLGYKERDDLLQFWRESKRYLLTVETLALILFLISLLIRFGNPDLWHPWKGGERPMDFSYFNAVLKSTTFPPYDPWFAGGYINYYYYGFVYVGVLTKLLGIMPSLAYNLILPTLFMMLGLGAFTLVWNLLGGSSSKDRIEDLPYLGGLGGVIGLVILGNLGVMRMVFQGLQRLASGGVDVLTGSFFQRLKWTLAGFVQLFRTPTLHYRLDE